MVARKRKHGESFEQYRKNLQHEHIALNRRLGGKMSYHSVQFLDNPLGKLNNMLKQTMKPFKKMKTTGSQRNK